MEVAPSSSIGPSWPAMTVSESSQKAVVVGVCALDVKARSKAMREILTRLVERGGERVEVKIFGDKVIFDEGECYLCNSNSLS